MNSDSPIAILAAGEFILTDALRPYWDECTAVYCTDGAADRAFELGLTLTAVVGDMDSISPGARKQAELKNVELIELHEQETNDLEKTLRIVRDRGHSFVRIFGIGGFRVDHTLANLSVGLRWTKLMKSVTLFDTTSKICFLDETNPTMSLTHHTGQTVSLMPLSNCCGVRTWGMEYELTGEELAMGIREGLSNVIVSSLASISLEAGALMVAVQICEAL